MKPRIVLLACALVVNSCGHPGAEGDQDDAELSTGSCGVERWDVKTGTDPAAGQVSLTPQDTTIAALRALPVPAGLAPGSPRFPGTAEMQVFRLTNVNLRQYKMENDSDYHLVLSDAAGNTMIAELAYPGCVSGGPFASAISAARAAFDARFVITTSFQTANVPVTLTGAGFFDLLHGQTGVAPNGIELHAVLSICIDASCGGGPDFALSASPAGVTGTGTSTVTVSAQNGFAGTVDLSASGVPAGATASFAPPAIAASGTSTLTLSAGSAAPGTYVVNAIGTSGNLSHSAAISWTIPQPGGGALTNGDFETGSLAGWTVAGTATVVSTAHGGAFAARIGSTSPSMDSSISQTVALPAGRPQLSFWYKVVCPDTVAYDWATVVVESTAGALFATPLPRTCTNTGTWANVTADLTAWAGQTVVVQLMSHDDDYPGDPTYTLYDDVRIVVDAPPQDLIVNGGFEGSLSGWMLGGSKLPIDSSAVAHTGSHSLRCGATSAPGSLEPEGDSSAWQDVAILATANKATLSFWYFASTTDTIQYDWQQAEVRDTAGNTLVSLFRICSNRQAWLHRTQDLTAYKGQTVRIWFNAHGDGATDPTTLWIDDVALLVE